MDFDDLLVYTNILLRDNPYLLEKYQNYFEYILVENTEYPNFHNFLYLLKLSL